MRVWENERKGEGEREKAQPGISGAHFPASTDSDHRFILVGAIIAVKLTRLDG